MSAEIWAALSSVGAMTAALIMLFQTFYQASKDRLQERKVIDIELKMLRQKQLESKIMINQMWNELNKIVITGPEAFRGVIANKEFKNIDSLTLTHIFWVFMVINVIEIAWLLHKEDSFGDKTAEILIKDQLELLRGSPDIVRTVMDNRGYSEEFRQFVYSTLNESTTTA